MGLLCRLPFSLVFYANSNSFTLNHILADGVWHMVERGIGGIVMALIYAHKTKTA